MRSWMGRGVFALLLLAQAVDGGLQQDYLATRTGSPHALVTIIAVHQDGTPVRGYIQCAGEWFKHADEDTVIWSEALPFKTDSRGAVTFNPRLEDEQILCWCIDNGMRGDIAVNLSGTHIETLVLNRKVSP